MVVVGMCDEIFGEMRDGGCDGVKGRDVWWGGM